ncbi:hypothetical protein D3C87_1265300 [compost metagenome]
MSGQFYVVIDIIHDPYGPVDFRTQDEHGGGGEAKTACEGSESGQRHRAQHQADAGAGHAQATADIMVLSFLAVRGRSRIKGFDRTCNIERQGDQAGE